MIANPQTEERKQGEVVAQGNGKPPIVGDGYGGVTADGAKLDTRFKTQYSIGVNVEELEKELKKATCTLIFGTNTFR